MFVLLMASPGRILRGELVPLSVAGPLYVAADGTLSTACRRYFERSMGCLLRPTRLTGDGHRSVFIPPWAPLDHTSGAPVARR